MYGAGPSVVVTCGPNSAGPTASPVSSGGTGSGAVTSMMPGTIVTSLVTAPTAITFGELAGELPVASARAGVALGEHHHHAGVDGRLGGLHHRIGPRQRVLVAGAPRVADDVGAVDDGVLDGLHQLGHVGVAVLEVLGLALG